MVNRNALRFAPNSQYDLIWCAGLFDYLNDKAAVYLLKKFRNFLTPGGSEIIGNFGTENPSRVYMEIFGRLFLLHRTAEDLRAVAAGAGFAGNRTEITADDTGLNFMMRVWN